MTKLQIILDLVRDKKIQLEQAEQWINSLPKSQIEIKISQKGAISVYNVRRKYPITLYSREWEIILEKAADIQSFIRDNRNKIEKVIKKRFQPPFNKKSSLKAILERLKG